MAKNRLPPLDLSRRERQTVAKALKSERQRLGSAVESCNREQHQPAMLTAHVAEMEATAAELDRLIEVFEK